MRTLLRSLWWAVPTTAALALLVGPAEPPDVRTSPSNAARPVRTLPAFPLDDFRVSSTEASALREATATLTNDCLTEFGLDRVLDEDAAPVGEFTDRRYGVLNLDHAERFGYHLSAEQAEALAAPQPAASVLEQAVLFNGAAEIPLQNGHLRTLLGRPVNGIPIPPGGCFGRAEAALDVAGTPDTQLAEILGVQVFEDALIDSEVRAAFADWSGCMATKGHTVADPLLAAERADLSIAEPTIEERRLAVADVECKEQVDLVKRWSDVEIRLQTAAIAENRNALGAARGLIDQSVVNATDVLQR